jgi:hypothetical protein
MRAKRARQTNVDHVKSDADARFVFTTFTNKIYEKRGNAFTICVTIHNQSEWSIMNSKRFA